MRITERKLLAGLDGLTKGGDLISKIGEVEIRWNYRVSNGGCQGYCVTDTRANADIITLECDRHGHLPLLKHLSADLDERRVEAERLYRTIGGDEV